MTRLLVSVRSADEAREALAGGAGLIDIKEPARGALGAANVHAWREVIAAVAGRALVSAALGELCDDDVFRLAHSAGDLAFVKAGPAFLNAHQLQQRWRCLLDSLPPGPQLVAVAYADCDRAQSPSPQEIVAAAAALALPVLLIDTFDKSKGDLWSALSLAALRQTIIRAQQCGIQVALAGSLAPTTIPQALALQPDWIAVRGAACDQGERSQRISRERVANLASLVAEIAQHPVTQ